MRNFPSNGTDTDILPQRAAKDTRQDWQAFAKRYIEEYIQKRPKEIAAARGISEDQAPLISKTRLTQEAKHNLNMLHILAFSKTPLDKIIKQQVPTDTPNRNIAVQNVLDGLQHVCKFMADESPDLSLSYHLQREVLESIVRKWVDLRHQAWENFLQQQPKRLTAIRHYLDALNNLGANPPEEDVRTLNQGFANIYPQYANDFSRWDEKKYDYWMQYISAKSENTHAKERQTKDFLTIPGRGGERKFNSETLRAFNTFWKQEDATYLHTAIKGLVHGYTEHQKQFTRTHLGRRIESDIEAQALEDLRGAMRTYEFGHVNAEYQREKTFPPHLMIWQQKGFQQLRALHGFNTRNPEKIKFLKSISTLDAPITRASATTGASLVEDPDAIDVSHSAELNIQRQKLNGLLRLLDERSQQILMLHFNLDVPYTDPLDSQCSEEQRQETADLREKTINLRCHLHEMREQDTGRVRHSELPALSEIVEALSFDTGGKPMSREGIRQIELKALRKMVHQQREISGERLDDSDSELEAVQSIVKNLLSRSEHSNGR